MTAPTRTIVVGYDGSEAAERALARAADLAPALSARLVVVSVGAGEIPVAVPEPAAALGAPVLAGPLAVGGTVPLPPAEVSERLADEAEDPARRLLEQARRRLMGRDVDAEYVVELGDPADRLLEVAERCDADLVVVGARERSLLQRLFERPVEDAVARGSQRDVLLVH